MCSERNIYGSFLAHKLPQSMKLIKYRCLVLQLRMYGVVRLFYCITYVMMLNHRKKYTCIFTFIVELLQVVNILYRENDWVYVIAADSRQEGFIPHSYCTPYNSHLGELALSNVKKKLPREQRNGNNNSNGSTVGAGSGEVVGETDLQETRTNGGTILNF